MGVPEVIRNMGVPEGLGFEQGNVELSPRLD
jgi:hypothetical protein